MMKTYIYKGINPEEHGTEWKVEGRDRRLGRVTVRRVDGDKNARSMDALAFSTFYDLKKG